MVFSSTVFLLAFLPLVVCVYYNPWIRTQRFRNVFLLLASLGFYAWGEPVFVFLMLISILLTWLVGIAIDKSVAHKKMVLSLGVIYHIAILFVFKYLAFFTQQMGWLILHKDVELGIELPIGISFFTFQMMSYLFDVYYGKAGVQKNIMKLSMATMRL